MVEDRLPLQSQNSVVDEDTAIDLERARISVLKHGFPQRVPKVHVDQ
jgi:hypothetical protein